MSKATTTKPGTKTGTQSLEAPVADRHDLIRVRGARVNNLKDVSIEIATRNEWAPTADLVAARSTLTGEHLAAYVDSTGKEA